MRFFAMFVAVAAMSCLAEDEPVISEADVQLSEANVQWARKQVDDVRKANRELSERTERILEKEGLVSGERKPTPRKTTLELPVAKISRERLTLDNRGKGLQKDGTIVGRLKLPRSGKYRLRAKIAVAEMAIGARFAFGCRVQEGSKKKPATFVESAELPFSPKGFCVDFDLPDGASASYVVGFEKGSGIVTIDNFQVFELREVLQ